MSISVLSVFRSYLCGGGVWLMKFTAAVHSTATPDSVMSEQDDEAPALTSSVQV